MLFPNQIREKKKVWKPLLNTIPQSSSDVINGRSQRRGLKMINDDWVSCDRACAAMKNNKSQ